MAIAPVRNAALRVLLILIAVCLTREASGSDLVNDLVSLQSQSDTGVIHMDDHVMSRFVTSSKAPRPYQLLIFFDAIQLHDKSELRLLELKREFALLASSYIANNPDPSGSSKPLFFCEIEFKESQSTFALFGVNSLPHVRLIGPDVRNPKESVQMDQGDFARLADSMAEFVESRTGLEVGPIHRPPPISKKQLAFVAIALLIWTPFMIKRVLSGQTFVHNGMTWLAGALFVYFFSVSGTMHNIIRRMPMFISDREDPSKLVFFYQGSGMQLGAEGFAVGSLYTVVGLILAFITHLVVRIRNVSAQRVVMVVAMLVCFFAVRKVIFLDNWKTGYAVHGYWPSSWR